jgi:hypothetical protein
MDNILTLFFGFQRFAELLKPVFGRGVERFLLAPRAQAEELLRLGKSEKGPPGKFNTVLPQSGFD